MKIERRLVLFALAALLALATALFTYARLRSPAEGWERFQEARATEGPEEERIKALFADEAALPADHYEALLIYFLRGFTRHAAPDFAAVHYRGWGNIYGWRVNGLEGFARTAPLFAAWVHSGRTPVIVDRQSGQRFDLIAMLRSAMLAGTDAASPSYWGDIGADDQRIVESADIARILWLTRAQIWDALNDREQKQIAAWLSQAVRARISYENNWLLFPVIVDEVLHDLGAATGPVDLKNYHRFRNAYRESGWFADPPEAVDFYTTWATAYELYWLHRLDPAADADFIGKALSEAASLTSHLIGPEGIPILGRSICYRTAVSVPLLVDHLGKDTSESAGLARRALDVTWRYFIARGSLRDGALTQGYFGPDPRFVDAYTGPGSCHWGLRSLVLAFMTAPQQSIWTHASLPLPIEVADYHLDLPKIGWRVAGMKATGNISIVVLENARKAARPDSYGALAQLKELVFRHPGRPDNHAVKFELHEYASRDPFPAQGLAPSQAPAQRPTILAE